jgi:hypothetical protein
VVYKKHWVHIISFDKKVHIICKSKKIKNKDDKKGQRIVPKKKEGSKKNVFYLFNDWINGP